MYERNRFEPLADLPHQTGRLLLGQCEGDTQRAHALAMKAAERAATSIDRSHWRDAAAWVFFQEGL